MQVIRTTADLRTHLKELRLAASEGAGSVGFVPTMGALHDGHLSLVRAAREQHATVVMSIFVNPTQFNDGNDFSSYPRDDERDLALAREAGTDVVFMPEVEEMYPTGFATKVTVAEHLTGVLEGAVRGREHFDGMATIVTKLLLAVQPDAAYFGAKDFQQFVVVRRLVEDLGLPVSIVACPTLRESDGLALSSRNVRLRPVERLNAAAIPATLRAISQAVADGERDISVLQELGRGMLVAAGLEIEYLEFVTPETLEQVSVIEQSVVCALAVSTASTRLIDNELLVPNNVERDTRVA